jgi:hypothetical protein
MQSFDIPKYLCSLISDAIKHRSFDELSWIDYKTKWSDLSTQNTTQHYEFLRDMCALANSGQNAYLVFGVDQQAFAISGSPWKECRLADTADIINRVRPRVDPPFDFDIADFGFEDKTLSYVYIPAAHNRPHIIKKYIHKDKKGTEYQFTNALITRTGSQNISPYEYPDRQKLALMFLDRPLSFAQLLIKQWNTKIHLNEGGAIWIPIQICNIGNTPTSILQARISARFSDTDKPWDQLEDRDIDTYIGKNRTEHGTIPLHIPAATSIPIYLQVNIANENLHSMIPYWHANKSKKLIVHVRVWDMLEMQYIASIECGYPYD